MSTFAVIVVVVALMLTAAAAAVAAIPPTQDIKSEKQKPETRDQTKFRFSFFLHVFVGWTQPIIGRRHFASIIKLLVRRPISDDYRVDSRTLR